MSILDILNPASKDPRWLELEICREFQRHKCPRAEPDCKFSHAPPHVTVAEGRVTACYDSVRGRCHRRQPACKYFHPPPHLAHQLLANGRKYLELKNLILGQVAVAAAAQQQAGLYMAGLQRPVAVAPNLGVPTPYIYPPPTIIPPSKSPQVSPPIPTCETIPYPGMFLYKKSVEYKPALYAPALYPAHGLLTPAPAPGVDFGQVHKIAKGVYGQRVKRYY